MEKTVAKNNGMSVAGFIFGLLCMLTCFTVVFVPVLAGLGICLSILSRGDGSMTWLARLGIIFSVIGILLAFILGNFIIISTPGLLNNIFERLYFWVDPDNWLTNIGHYSNILGNIG